MKSTGSNIAYVSQICKYNLIVSLKDERGKTAMLLLIT